MFPTWEHPYTACSCRRTGFQPPFRLSGRPSPIRSVRAGWEYHYLPARSSRSDVLHQMLVLALPERFIFLKKATQNHAASLSTISGIPSIGCSMQENVCMDVFYSVVKDQYMTGMKHPVALSSHPRHLLVPPSVMSD